MESSEIGAILRHPAAGATVRNLVDSFPRIHMEAQLQPITRQASLGLHVCFAYPLRNHIPEISNYSSFVFECVHNLTLIARRALFSEPLSPWFGVSATASEVWIR